MPPKQSSKRKDPPKSLFSTGSSSRDAKRARAQDARNIQTQAADQAVNDKGELDVGAFVRARQFEIEALEQSFKSSKHGLASRAFQEVPRQLRRRTASHNVKKVPRRLRTRAAKEMKEDKTPTTGERRRNKDLTAKQRVRQETAKKAAAKGVKAASQREALAKIQDKTPLEPTAKTQKELYEHHQEQQSAPGRTAGVTKGNEAPAAIQPINPPQRAKGILTKPPTPVSRFRQRQKEKTWLPTHVFHAKRAHMTLPNQPLWRFAIPLSPTERVYRTTHRAANIRGCIAWDTSYTGTILLEGEERSILGALLGLGVPKEMLSGSTSSKWRAGARSWTGWIHDRDKPDIWISQASIFWCAEEEAGEDSVMSSTDGEHRERKRRKLFLRVHPAGFWQTWQEALKICKMQRPQVSIQDLRFDIGSIEVEGPAATEALAGILHPLGDESARSLSISRLLSTLGALSDASSLPLGVLMNITLQDPRLRHPPRKVDLSYVSNQDILDVQSKWPFDDAKLLWPGLIFDGHARHASCRLQSSQKAINRRHGDADPGEYPSPLSSDPRIPALLAFVKPNTSSRHAKWVLMLPWHWVLPVWRSLMYFPLATGSNPRFGGLQEKHQLSFERGEPFYPADFPGTSAGWDWETAHREKRRQEHERKPKAKRIDYTKLDLGNGEHKGEIGGPGWACAWERLFASKRKPGVATAERNEQIRQVLAGQLANTGFGPHPESIMTVRLSYIQRGVPATCARIYRLPTTDSMLRERWLKLLEEEIDEPDQRRLKLTLAGGRKGSRRGGGGSGKKGKISSTAPSSYPPVPREVDLVGFVTTGNFNLAEGRGTAIGGLALQRVWIDGFAGRQRLEGICIVRNAGTAYGRLARWSST